MRICKICGGRVIPNNFSVDYYCYKCGSIKHNDIHIPIKKGTKIRAKDNLKMNGSPLIYASKDKIYSISKIKFEFIDEQGDSHTLPEDFIIKYFDIL